MFCLFDNQIGQCSVVSQGFRRQGLTCGSLKVRVCCSPESLQPLIDMSSLLSRAGANTPQNICSQTALMEPYWHRMRTRRPHLNTQFPGRGQMAAAHAAAPSSLRSGQITRRNGLQVPPQARLCHSPLTTLWWLPMFPPVKRQIVQQTALLWIHPAVHFSKEVKENPWPELLNFEAKLSEKLRGLDTLQSRRSWNKGLSTMLLPQWRTVNPTGTDPSRPSSETDLRVMCAVSIINRNVGEDEMRTLKPLFLYVCGNTRQFKTARQKTGK